MSSEKKRGGAKVGHAPTRKGGRTQTHTGFRIDNDLLDKLRQQPNMGRFVNQAIREKFQRGEQ